MKIYPMSPADAAWFHNDGPANLAIVTGVLLTKQPLNFDNVRTVCQRRLLHFDRFRQRVVERGFPVAAPQWEDMPHFDINQHVHHIALAAPHDQVALRALVSDIASTPLDHAQPLWQVYVVDDVEGGSALIMRCHHCIADGTGMITVTRKLLDTDPGAWQSFALSAPPAPAEPSRPMALNVALMPSIPSPKHVIESVENLFDGAGMLVGELLKKDDPESPMKGEFGMGKRVAWSRPVSIKDVKAIGMQHKAKVNDVLVAAMTGALRTYLQGRGVDVNHTTVRAMVPVDLRPPERAEQLGNEFGLVILELAISSARPAQRLELTKVRMDALKRSSEPIASRVMLEVLGRMPKAVEDFSNELFTRKASLVMTNVAGPREVLYLAGVPVDRILAWAPHPGKQLGMAVSIYSYHDQATLTVISDAHLLSDPEVIADYFNQEFHTMLHTLAPTRAKTPARRTPTPRKAVHANR